MIFCLFKVHETRVCVCGRGGEVSRGLAGNTTVMGNFTSVRQHYKHGGHVAGLRV